MLPSEKAHVVRGVGDATTAAEALAFVMGLRTSTPCYECEHFCAGMCGKAKAAISEHVARTGCEMFEEQIPF